MQKEAQNFVGTADFSVSRDKIDRFNWFKCENWNVTANSFAKPVFLPNVEVKMVSTAAEIDNLGLNLKKVQEKFMEWTGDTFKRSFLEDKKNHENMMLLNGKGMWAYVYNNGYTAGTTDRISIIAFFPKKKYYCVFHGFLLLTEKMKHLEETIKQYHIQSEKNLEGEKA